MSKEFDDIISEKVKELPSHAPTGKLWETIEDALNTEDAIRRQLADLPLHTPPPHSWEAIEAALPAKRGSVVRRRLLYLTATAAAAGLLLLVIPRLQQTGPGIVVESEVALTEEISGSEAVNHENEDLIEMITSLCRSRAPVCQSATFAEKLQLYRELNAELRQLETVIDQVGDSPVIIQSIIRIENLKSSTLQELIQLVHS